jgi:hypothetical protein
VPAVVLAVRREAEARQQSLGRGVPRVNARSDREDSGLALSPLDEKRDGLAGKARTTRGRDERVPDLELSVGARRAAILPAMPSTGAIGQPSAHARSGSGTPANMARASRESIGSTRTRAPERTGPRSPEREGIRPYSHAPLVLTSPPQR